MDEDVVKYLRAVVALQAELLANVEGSAKPEIVLARAGLPHKEIAAIVGKPQTAISKAISRATTRGKANEDG